MWGVINRDRHLRIPSQKYQLGEMTCSGNLCAKSRPVDIVLQIAHFLSIKDSLSCKEPADLEDKAARNMPHNCCIFNPRVAMAGGVIAKCITAASKWRCQSCENSSIAPF